MLAALTVISTPGTFEKQHINELAANPADLHFALLISNGQKRFHPGETIPITLEFFSSAPEKYKLDAGSYDRSGRLWSEEFSIDRDGAIDPLADYFGSGVMATIGGGLRSTPVLSSQPVLIHLILNDWFRFDNPGRYRLFLKSNRLERERLPSESGTGTVRFAAVSNILEIEISEPDTAWQAAKVLELSRILDSPREKELPIDDQTISKAERALGDLGTAEAVRLMFAKAREIQQPLPSLALIRSPERAVVITEMDRYLEDPNVAFDSWALSMRVLFDFVKRYPEPFAPTTPAAFRTFDRQKIQAEAEKRHTEFEGMRHALAVRLIPAVARKIATVREECIRAIGEAAPVEAKAAGFIEPDDYGMTRAQLIEGFNGFPPKWQLALLSEKWNLLRGPEMLPMLRFTIEHAPHDSTPSIFPASMAWPEPSDLAEYALYRLRELAPDEERAILLNDITLPKPKFADTAVRELPAQEVPKADEAITANLNSDPMTALSAVPVAAKFGTRRLLRPMLSLYKGPDGPCIMDDWFVAYFVRTDAAKGAQILSDSMAAREKSACFQSLLGRVAAITWNPVVQEQALRTLTDADGEAASDAARTLAAHGGRELQATLLDSLEQWSEQWRGRAAALERNAITGANPHEGDSLRGYSLFRAMADATAWVIDEPMAQGLASLCVDEACRSEWTKYKIGSVRIQNATGIYGSGRLFRIGLRAVTDIHAVEERMAQYPAGSVFQWCPQELPNEFGAVELDSAGREIGQFAAKHGMRMEACQASARTNSIAPR
jgi:hypothetical protein